MMPCCLAIFSILNQGSPIFIPRDFTSFDLATAQPSLLESTTTGLPSSLGLNIRSQET